MNTTEQYVMPKVHLYLSSNNCQNVGGKIWKTI